MERARVPPALVRLPTAPPRTNSKKLRLAARLTAPDLGRMSHSASSNQIVLENSTKSHSKNAFDTVFGAETTQDEVSASVLPDLLHSLFNGIDCSLLCFGGFSKSKETCLYEAGPLNLGLYQNALHWTFRLVDEFKAKRPEFRFSVRISAVYFSQRENQLVDLLSQFNTDPRRHEVRVVDDPTGGTRLEHESELRVDSAEQALFYLNTVIDHRLVEDDDSHRANHLFFSIVLYGFRSGPGGAVEGGGKSRFAVVDLGIGERNSQKGTLTMPAIGNILLALCQGQKYIPSRENVLCRLLKISLAPSKNITLLCTFTERTDENENMMQLASKLSRAKRTSRRVRPLGDGSSQSSGSRRGGRSEVESSSEQSAPETVIFMGPTASRIPQGSPHRLSRPPSQSSAHSAGGSTLVSNGSSGGRTVTSIPPLIKNHTPFFSPVSRLYDDLCSPSTSKAAYEIDFRPFSGVTTDRNDYGITIESPKRSKSRQNLDEEKRKAIMTWMDGHEAERTETGTQCGDGEIEREEEEEEEEDEDEDREPWLPQRPPLEDIIEMDEESMRSSIRSMQKSRSREFMTRSDPREREGLAEHPLSILSRDGLNHISSINEDAFRQEEAEDDDLERAMAASVSSMKSHEILSRVANELQRDSVQTNTNSGGTASEMDMYRRASQLEGYAIDRMRELDEERKKKKQKMLLNCCQQQQSMSSSSSTVVNNWEQLEKRKEKEEERRRKDDLRRRKDELKAEELELRRQRQEIKKELEEPGIVPPLAHSIARQITNQLHRFNLGSSPKHQLHPVSVHRPSDSLPSTPTVSHRKLPVPVRTPSLHNMRESSASSRENGRLTSQNGKPLCFQPLAPRASSSSSQSRHSKKSDRDSRRGSKTRSRERRSSETSREDVVIRSPYSKVTDAKKDNGGGSSGRGSDDNASAVAHPLKRSRNRDSYSASSGYESASADYHRYTAQKDRARLIEKRSVSAVRQIERLREEQSALRARLIAARERLGQRDAEVWTREHELGLASPPTVVDTLLQENRILEKRLIACQNHTVLVTSFL